MTDKTFNFYTKYYDLLYKDKDYSAEVEYIISLFDRVNLRGSKILEFGSGTGIHGTKLADRGYSVTGIEKSSEMVKLAKSRQGFKCIQGDIQNIRLDEVFDAVISLFHVVSYQVENYSVLEVFKSANKHLKPNGVFIFDFWYSPAVLSQKPNVRVKRMSDNTSEITRIAEPDVNFIQNCVEVNYRIIAKNLTTFEAEFVNESHLMRHFSIPELDLFAQMSGFERILCEEFLSCNVPNDETWGICVAFKKIK